MILPAEAFAECRLVSQSDQTVGLFSRELSEDCSRHDREAHAVKATEILRALKDGKEVRLDGVVVTGDLDLAALPPLPPMSGRTTVSGLPSDFVEVEGEALRRIRGPLSIRDSVVRGRISTNLKSGHLVVQGPVTFTGTLFERAVDLSRSVFLESVDVSGTVFLRECLFVQADFLKPARFEKTAFGPRTRFHKARFRDTVSFVRAGFNGMGEFLEVTFDRDAIFSRTYFKQGTGFSGSRFRGMLDFSEALFEREAFFTYTIFERDAYFRRATFRGQADFSDAEFRGADDFSKVLFEKEPRFIRTKTSGRRPGLGGLHDPGILYGIAGALLIFTLLFVFVLRKG